MIKKIFVTLILFFTFLILLGFNLFNYFHFQILTNQQQSQINHIESLLKETATSFTSIQANIREFASTQLTGEGVYMNGECAPAPICPVGYQPEIYVFPISLSTMDTPKQANSSMVNANFSAFSAFAVGKFHDVLSPPTSPDAVSNCNRTQAEVCTNHYGPVNANNKFWRVCLYMNNMQPAQGWAAVFTQCLKRAASSKSWSHL